MSMSVEHEELKRILAEAAAQTTPGARAAYLDAACAGDAALRAEIDKLLQAHDQAGAFLEQPALPPPQPTIVLSTPLSEKPGDKIGHYKLLQQIGEGGCGVVYMAEQEEPIRRRVALKVIKLGMDTKQVIARFEAERQALALMDHPNIAKVLDAGATDTGRPYFVMELVRGIKITDYCDKNHLPTRDRLNLFIQTCQAIQHAHQKGVIHRDIKPSNILVTMNDGVPMPKVIDFGIAKATQQRLTDKTLFTAFEQFIGTPAYMSPEQAEMSASGIDTRSDIYSLGILLYELLTGTTPFDAKALLQAGLDEIRRIIREQEPMRPSTRLSTMLESELTTTAQQRQANPPKLIHLVRGDLDWIVMKALEKDRSRRYDTANGLAMDVQRFLADEPIAARPPSGVYRFQKLVRRHKLVFAAASAVVVSLIFGLVLFTWQWRKAVVAREETTREAVAEAQARERAEQALGLMEIQKAEEYFNADNPSTALAYLARVLRQNPKNGTVAARVFSSLTKQVLIIPLADPLTHTDAVYSARFSPGARRIVTASADGTAQLWDVKTGEPLTAPLRHSAAVWSADFSPDGRRVATASEDKTARVWDADTGKPLTPPLEHSGSVGYVWFSPDGERLVTGTWEPDWRMRIWDSKSGRPLIEPIAEVHRLRCLPFSMDGRRFVTPWSTNSVVVWDALTGAKLVGPLAHDNFVWAAEFSPDGQRILTTSHDGMARIWDAATGQPLVQPLNNGGPLWLARFSPDGQRVLTVCNDMTIQFWDSSTGRALTGPLNYGSAAELKDYRARFGEHA
jgi:serine/threonine protein kinase